MYNLGIVRMICCVQKYMAVFEGVGLFCRLYRGKGGVKGLVQGHFIEL